MTVKDTQLEFPHFTVLKASAGSGKTYALARRFVLFLLSERVPRNRLNNLLAITFSNNAAKEMKERILDLLKKICLGDPDALAEFTFALSVPEEVLKAKAEEITEEILSDYSDFQVKTIDSFMATVFKASAIDFGYNPDFEILMSNETLMEYAFHRFLRNVREGTRESVFMNEIIGIIMDARGAEAAYLWDPTAEILGEIKEIYGKIASCRNSLSIPDYAAAMEEIRRDIVALVDDLEGTIQSADLVKSKSSSYQSIHSAIRSGRFANLIGRGMKNGPVCKPKAKDGSGCEAYEQAMQKWQDLELLIAAYTKLYACSYYVPYIRVYEGFAGILEGVKRQEGKIFIEDVNKRLAEYLSRDLVLDVYFRLGEAIFHYLIDEFQDTSPIQWHNLFPLLENSLSQGGSLFVVGDTKQGIYGFRDADYRIMRDAETKNSFPSAHFRVEELNTNYRSDGAVVAFTEEVFQQTLPRMEEYRKAARESGLLSYRQGVRKERERRGFVETCLLERNDEEPPEKDKLYQLLDDLRQRGYRYSDITVLAPKNDDVVSVTTWLNAKGVPFLSYSSLDIRRRKITGEIISLLNFLDSPLDNLSFATFILGDIFEAVLKGKGGTAQINMLHDLCFRNRRSQDRALYKAFQEEMGSLWAEYFDRLFRLSGYLPLYDLIVEIYRVFEVFALFGDTEEAVFAKILEVVKDLEVKNAGNLRSFLQSAVVPEGDEADWNVDVPHGIDAVKVMTIHKAKGLGFPVVILLLYGDRNKGFRYIIKEDGETVTLLRLTKPMLHADEAFEKLYGQEEMKERVNKLNSLYVAFTRAGSELYVIGAKREKESFPFMLFPNGMSYRAGEPREALARKEPDPPTAEVFHHAVPPELPTGQDEGIRFREKSRGELIHKVLSLIDYVDRDIERKIDGIMEKLRRTMGGDEIQDNIKAIVREFLETEQVRKYYERRPGRVVMTEQEFSDSQGRLFRIDRVVADEERISIIEYKTGSDRENEEKYLAQMRNYIRIVGQVYTGRPVGGLIAYIDLKKAVPVGGSGQGQ